MFLQFIIALFVLRSSVGCEHLSLLTYAHADLSDNIFNFVSELAGDLLGFANAGTIFLTDKSVPKLGWFLVCDQLEKAFRKFCIMLTRG